jgi:outer membrane biosynthesis protein TonB
MAAAMGDSKSVWRAITVSLAIHLLLFVALPGLPPARPAAPAETTVRLALQPPAARTLTETPPSARVPETPPDATHLAEHAARAQNPEPADGNAPRSPGEVELFDFRPSDLLTVDARRRLASAPPAAESPPAAPSKTTAPSAAAPPVAARAERRASDVPVSPRAEQSPEPAVDRPAAPAGSAPAGSGRPRSGRDVRGVRTTGEMSLSTYAWTWAPYLRQLRDAIDARWHPPLMFLLGKIEGDGAIHFRVERDGSVSLVEVVAEEGHPSLVRAAQHAVEYAAPFDPLPPDFPESHLDVTWQYHYILIR